MNKKVRQEYMNDLANYLSLFYKVLNFKRIKSFFIYIKREGFQGVRRRYLETVELEKMHVGVKDTKQYDIFTLNEATSIEDFEPIVIPFSSDPKVSIIIPAYNQFAYTYNCIRSIVTHTQGVTYEICIVDDCSKDATKNITQVVENLQLIRNEKNIGYLQSCNKAASIARGDYLVMLNNDTQVQKDWLKYMISLMESDSKVGIVGAKLLYPDGILQEAGGIVWRNGTAANYGNRSDADNPEYNYVKEVDYVSGAALLIRKSLWMEIGGYDVRYTPAYYEDTDIAFETRKKNFKVMYQPRAEVIHFEGISNGKLISEGVKKYQLENYDKFSNKWQETLAQQSVNNEFVARDRSFMKKHILVIDATVPQYDQSAGARCTFMYLKIFVSKGYHVTFLANDYMKREPYSTEMEQLGIEILYGNYYFKYFDEWLDKNGHFFDYVYLQRPNVAPKYMQSIKKYTDAKIIYFAHDLHYLREMREYELTYNDIHLNKSHEWKAIEFNIFENVDVIHVVGSYEQGIVQNQFPNKAVRNIPLYIYDKLPQLIDSDFQTRHDLLYVGGFEHKPNVDAVLWFAKEIYPKVLKKYPEMKWHIVGGHVPMEIQHLASTNIIVEGFVSDERLENLYRESRIAVVPLRFGAGVKGKVVEAAYFQIPLITTSIGAEGLPDDYEFMHVKDSADDIAHEIITLYNDVEQLRKMSFMGKEYIKKHFMIKNAYKVIDMDFD